MSKPLIPIVAKKSLGQHFLNNEHVPKQMADAANINSNDTVLEIGAGTGVLTRELLARAAVVIAVETDARAVASLQASFATEIKSGALRLISADVRTAGIASFGVTSGAYKVVSNIPYYLSGRLFRTFLDTDIQPTDLVFLVQKEVAQRITRDPKESLLSLSVKVFGDPKYIKTVGRGNFSPAPKVDSAIIAITGISKDRLNGVAAEDFFTLIHAGLGAKRKQLYGNLTKQYPAPALTEAFSISGIEKTIRGEDLPLERWLELAKLLTINSSS